MSIDLEKGESLAKPLHLAWAIPLGLALSAPLWLIAQWGWCGARARGCYGLSTETVAQNFAFTLLILLTSAALAGAILLAAPWTSHRRSRIIAAVIAAAVPLVSGLVALGFHRLTSAIRDRYVTLTPVRVSRGAA